MRRYDGQARPNRKLGLALGWMLVALALGSLGPARSETRLNLLLVTIDTLRADYVGANGSTRVATPHLDRLARGGVNFRRARSPVPLTLPAHASMLTGLYPPLHGVRSNGEYRLAESQLSLAEVLGDAGFQTAAFVASFVLDRRFGLAQGFEHYDDQVWSEVAELESLEAERSAAEVAVAFEKWLGGIDTATPFFAWVHLYDPHAPYTPPEPYRSTYAKDPYAGEVAYADAVVGELLAELEARGVGPRTLVAVAGDHGEGLGDHGERTHSLLIYNSTLHVPMMLWAPGLVPAGRTIGELVRLIDLAPTLLDYLGLDASLGDGVSLRPLIERGEGASIEEIGPVSAYSESYYPELALGWSPLRGLESGDYRLILAPEPELFDVARDPGETASRVEAEPGVYQRLKRDLALKLREMEAAAGDGALPGEIDSETQAKLQALGYLAGGSKRPTRPGPPVDPNRNIELWNRIQRGIAEMGGGDIRAAIATFESALSEDPDTPLVYEYLGSCWQKLAAPAAAEAVYRRALERGIESARVHHELGRILAQRGETGAAERELQIALALDPESVGILYDLGNLYRAAGKHPQAIEHYRAALAVNPSYLWAWNGLAISLSALGDATAAADAFRRAVEIDPEAHQGHFNLALALERLGDKAAAIEHYQRFLDLEAGSASEAQRRQARAAIAGLSG